MLIVPRMDRICAQNLVSKDVRKRAYTVICVAVSAHEETSKEETDVGSESMFALVTRVS